MAKTPITGLMRIGWESVGRILAARRCRPARSRPSGRAWSLIGVRRDQLRRGHRFLTCVADHETGGVVWCAPGRNAATLQAFFDELTAEQKASIQAVSIDMSGGYEKADPRRDP